MVQKLTVCRIGAKWGFRDVTGAAYGQSDDMTSVVEAAERMARRIGGQVTFTDDALRHFEARGSGSAAEKMEMQRPPQLGFRGIAWRFARWCKR